MDMLNITGYGLKLSYLLHNLVLVHLNGQKLISTVEIMHLHRKSNTANQLEIGGKHPQNSFWAARQSDEHVLSLDSWQQLWFSPPNQHTIAIEGDAIPVRKLRSRRVKRIVAGLSVIAPIVLRKP